MAALSGYMEDIADEALDLAISAGFLISRPPSFCRNSFVCHCGAKDLGQVVYQKVFAARPFALCRVREPQQHVADLES